jgi:signal transduction histidine kinase
LGTVTNRFPRAFPNSLRARLNRVFLVGAVALIGVTTLATGSFIHLVHARHQLLDQVDPASLASDKLFIAYLDQETGVRGYLLSHNSIFLQPTVQGVTEQKHAQEVLNHSLTQQSQLLQLAHDGERQGAYWQSHFAQPAIRATAAANFSYGTESALEDGKHLFDEIRAKFSTLDRQLALSRSVDGSDLSSATTLLIAVLVAGLLLLLTGVVLLRRSLLNWVIAPLDVLRFDARRISQGDLSATIAVVGPTEIYEVGVDVDAMRQRIISELQELATAHSELARTNVELGRSNNELEQFAYVASHDLQEPLRKVTSFVQLLQERYRSQLDDRADQYIEFAVDGASRMQQLISDLLAFSRIGRTTDGFIAGPMRDCVNRAIGNLDIAVQEADVTFEFEALPDVFGDPSLLISLWQNLIGNSIKFRADASALIRIGCQMVDNEWVFSVTDNGIGIEPRFADKVFVIFQRLHGREAYEGTGIGLAMCRKIVEYHGGRIWLDQHVVSGSRICFTLPVANAKDQT